ncbi:MAG: nucleoside monophosphate kinase [Candidatus Thiodiazotropha endolucinida]|nr:nucleoside monophosphate kinase [Candidatus Thiodiazotropha endolucinida]
MRIVILGAPGSGKRTQTDLLADKYGLSPVMTGELVKDAVLKRTPLGLEIKGLQEAGRVVTEDIVLALLRERLLKTELQDGFVLDGFPRNLLQALTLDELMIEIDQPLDLILLIDIETDTLMERLVGRRTCRSCGLLYNIYRNPPVVDGVCDVCGGRLHRRSDDNEETVSSRIHVFDHLISPLITHYGKQGKLVKIDGNGEIHQVFQLICKTIDEGSRQSGPDASIEAQPVLEEHTEERDRSLVPEEATTRSAAETVAPVSVASREKKGKVPAPSKVVKKKATRKKADTKRAARKQTSKKKPAARQVVKKKASKKKSSTRTAAKSRAVKKKSSTHRTAQKKPVKKQPSKKKPSKKKMPKSEVAPKKKAATKKVATRPSPGKKAKGTTGSAKKRSNVSATSDRTAARQHGKAVKKRAKVKAKAKKKVSTKGVAKKRTPKNTGLKKVTAKVSSGKKTAVKKTKSKRSKSRKK